MDEYLEFFELLELPPDSSFKEIQKKYSYLRELYSCNSIELMALNEDFSTEMRAEYLLRLDHAFEKLSLLLKAQKPAQTPQTLTIDAETRCWIEQLDCFDGAALRSVRERLGIDLKDVYAVTRIQPHHLQELENEAFDFFRAEVYLRSFITEYARFLSLDCQRVLADYLPRYQAWSARQEGRGQSDIPDLRTLLG